MDTREYDLTDPIYDEGDERRCPVCRRILGSYRDLEFDEAAIYVTYDCECGYTLTFNYFLDNVIAEKE